MVGRVSEKVKAVIGFIHPGSDQDQGINKIDAVVGLGDVLQLLDCISDDTKFGWSH